VELVYDQIDFARIEAFLTGMPATSVYAVCEGFQRVGIKRNQGLGITEDLIYARSLFLTPNTTTVNGYTCLDLNGGPIVLQVPQGVLGPVDDADFRWVTDVGLKGPDAGKGRKYVFVLAPPWTKRHYLRLLQTDHKIRSILALKMLYRTNLRGSYNQK
jgi:hypothetical protein